MLAWSEVEEGHNPKVHKSINLWCEIDFNTKFNYRYWIHKNPRWGLLPQGLGRLAPGVGQDAPLAGLSKNTAQLWIKLRTEKRTFLKLVEMTKECLRTSDCSFSMELQKLFTKIIFLGRLAPPYPTVSVKGNKPMISDSMCLVSFWYEKREQVEIQPQHISMQYTSSYFFVPIPPTNHSFPATPHGYFTQICM